MQHRIKRTMWKCVLALFVTGLADPVPARADLYQTCIRTVEWLVDNSAHIVVVRFPADTKNGKPSRPTILQTLKGDAANIKWPLKDAPIGGYTYWSPPADGPVRLLYIRGTSELLQSVNLGRKRPAAMKIREISYGVTQHGRLLCNQSQLFHAIKSQMRTGPGKPVRRRKGVPHFERSGIEASYSFPLEADDETYVLIVSFTETRRDHYINALRTGDAAERLHAIHELEQLIDRKAEQALREATTCEDVSPTYRFQWNDRAIHVLKTDDVRKRARKALRKK